MTFIDPIFVALDTSAARNIDAIGFSNVFIELVKKKKWLIVTTIFIEDEIKKQKIKLLSKLQDCGLWRKHFVDPSDENKRRAEMIYYKSLSPHIKQADAQLIAAAVVHKYYLITDDFASLRVLKDNFLPAFDKLRKNSTVHTIISSDIENLISKREADGYYNKYKNKCFDNTTKIPRIYRCYDYQEIFAKFRPSIF